MGIDTRLSYGQTHPLYPTTSSLPQYPVSPISNPDTSSQETASSSQSSASSCGQSAQYYQPRECFVVPAEQRQNPRRSSSQTSKPPTLVRQDERKVSFVDSLVGKSEIIHSCCTTPLLSHSSDSATQMVEVIWPLSVAPPPCRPNTSGVLSLRRYIEETLRRSRTSYSTLQVALYYLVLIMPLVPKCDFTREQLVDSPAMRSLQCGRRMFLSALILASKYLQDRNYSAKAWSKMSGLKVAEINMNERAFLQSVNWKLHIPDNTFKRWTEVVLRYTPSQFPPPSGQSFSVPNTRASWKEIIPLLTPELDTIPVSSGPVIASPQPASAQTTPFASLPSFLEPTPEVAPQTPDFARGLTALPTPRATPPRSYTPAVSVASVESWPAVMRAPYSRRPSLVSSGSSLGSSPESTFSDVPRLSRSSSISSVSTSLTSMSSQSSISAAACLAKLANSHDMKPGQSLIVNSSGMPSSPIAISYDELKPFLTQEAQSLPASRVVSQVCNLERDVAYSMARSMPRIVEDEVLARPNHSLQYSVSQMLASSGSQSRKRSHCGQSDVVESLPRKQRCLSVAAH